MVRRLRQVLRCGAFRTNGGHAMSRGHGSVCAVLRCLGTCCGWTSKPLGRARSPESGFVNMREQLLAVPVITAAVPFVEWMRMSTVQV